MEKVNSLLRKARKRRFWTIEQAAALVGVSYQTFIRWEHGIQNPQLDSLQALCHAFKATPKALGFGPLVDGNDD
ncbi:MAG: helix-turn-helix transcriptional regulator [Chloroflexi bacterium]|nr:MAG: helix-turn-helix transcriptional regulator [Chloroflexota bacterium]